MKIKIKKPKNTILYILTLAFLIRLPGLNQSLWLDEGVQAGASQLNLNTLLTQYMPGDFNPPGYHLLLHFWIKVFGSSEIAVRLPSVILGTASVYLLYQIAKKMNVKKTLKLGKWQVTFPEMGAFLLTISGLHIYYSQEARMYMLASFAVLMSVNTFLNSLKSKKKKDWFMWALSLVLVMYSHYLAWLMIPVFMIYCLFNYKKNTECLLFGLGLSFLGFMPWLPGFLKQLKTGTQMAKSFLVWGETVGSASLKSAILLPIKFLIGRVSIDSSFLYILLLAPILLLTSFIFFKSLKNRQEKINFLWIWLVLPPLLGFLISFKVGVFSYFRFLFALPAFYLVLSHGVLNWKSKLNSYAFEFLVFVSLLTTATYLTMPRFHRENWRDAVGAIEKRNQQNAKILILGQVQKPFLYYYQGQAQVLDYKDVKRALNDRFVWLVKYGQPIFDPKNQVETGLITLGFEPIFERHYRGGVTIKKLVNLNP